MSEQNETAVAASALGGRTARACESCLRRRARWFCAADDAFLCQACDAAVHSANALSRRHQRLRLNTSSSSSSPSPYKINTVSLSDLLKPNTNTNNSSHDPIMAVDGADYEPKWHHGFMRKPRTPRPRPGGGGSSKHIPLTAKSTESLVPDLEAAALAYDIEEGGEEEKHELLYRVPVFDPVLFEFCPPPPPILDDVAKSEAAEQKFNDDLSSATNSDEAELATFLPSEKELVEFAADMETLLGCGVDDTDSTFCMDDLEDSCIKTEPSLEDYTPMELIVEGPLDDDERKTSPSLMNYVGEEEEGQRRLILSLDYDAVIEAWSTSSSTSPWRDGERPQMKPDECLSGFMVYCQTVAAVRDGHGRVVGDGGREARVSRYREKRRTRLFSKKIRYEVRKLNAEKRPRMKGRFVKRSTAAVQPSPAAATGFAY